jgi:hypothetical protein
MNPANGQPYYFSDDLEYLPALVSLPPITMFEYLIGSWKRLNAARSALMKKVSYTFIHLMRSLAQIFPRTIPLLTPNKH